MILQDRGSKINSREIAVKDSSDTKYRKYKPNQLLGYSFNGEVFTSAKIESNLSNVFLNPIITGRLSLYYSQGIFYIRKDTMGLRRIDLVRDKNSKENRTYRGLLNSLTRDCESVRADQISSNLDSLVEFICLYNNCMGVASKKYRKAEIRSHFKFGASIGQTISSISLTKYRGVNNPTFEPSKSIIYGVHAEHFYTNSNFSLRFEAAYNELSYIGKEPKSSNLVQFNSSQIRFAFGGLTGFRKCWATPYAGLGASFFVPVKFEAISRYKGVFGGIDQKVEDSFNPQIGFWLTFGIKRKIGSGLIPFVETRIENAFGYGANNQNLSPGANPIYGTFLFGFLF